MLALDAAPVPTEFVAVTDTVYATPFVNPVMTSGDDAPVAVNPPGVAVAVYPVIAAPPLLAGAVKAIEICPSPAVAVPIVGAGGTAGANAAEGSRGNVSVALSLTGPVIVKFSPYWY